ncbi:hypothetical protein EG327_007940 [Venturia inaequalis]|uniref:Uncharacterized protein n=1 Tax=Venturia inaequalis TaxID=5025 RepID=A0A8H3VTM3_VENIN|nr:hypothetical protein EG327_007940 [Venturia inaequalis]
MIRVRNSTSEQRQPILAIRDPISRGEELGGPELHQSTSSKDWAMQHQINDGFPPASRVEVVHQSLGQQGRLLVWIGLALMLIIYQFDNALLYNYSNYATSNFNKVSALGALGTASGIIFAVAKPPIAKLSDVVGRGETYALMVSFMVLSYILSATFCSQLDLGGVFLLVAGSAMFLLPFSLSSTTPKKWNTPWVIALIVVGSLTLICLVFYESRMAKNPILPPKYLRNTSIVLCCLLGAFDAFAFASTHAYFYSWLTITHNFGPRNATFVTYVNGVFSCLTGILGGLVVSRFRRYKWLIVGGAIVKLLGYGLMLRVRGANNSTAELVIVQALQGMGSGLLDITIIVVAQIQVPRIEMAQVTALVLLCTFLGSSIGSAVAGGIYTGTFKQALRKYLGTGSSKLVDTVFDSITGKVPAPGTFQRNAINRAYSDVLRFITYSAVATSIVVLGLAVVLPSFRLRDGHNLVEGTDADTELEHPEDREASTDNRDRK